MCELPDVKFENFAAARSCLQSTLAPIGAIVKSLSIQQDQNGKAKWRVHIAASGSFPAPTQVNFVAVRALLNQHVPRRSVLSTILLFAADSNVETWLWEVTYGIKKVSKLRKAITTLQTVINTITPCLKTAPLVQTAIKKKKSLEHLERTKKQRRFFYELRQLRKATKNVPKPEAKHSQPYGQFVKGDVLHPIKREQNVTSTKSKGEGHNIRPNYAEWDVKHLMYQMKSMTLQDLKCLDIIHSCDDETKPEEYYAAVLHIKNRIPQIRAEHVPKLLKEGFENLGVTHEFIRAFTLKGDTFDRVIVKDHQVFYETGNHCLCTH